MAVGESVEALLDLAGPALGPTPSGRMRQLAEAGDDWGGLLCRVNGFYAFESALHVLPSGTKDVMSVERWNSANLWRHEYDDLADGLLFFAEDVFGGQFAFAEEGIYTFDPETGDRELIADDLDEWATQVLDDYEVLTGYPLAHEWQRRHGPLAEGLRLVPKRPFFAGGEFELDNLYAIDAVEGMGARGSIAMQIRDLPDGTTIQINIGD